MGKLRDETSGRALWDRRHAVEQWLRRVARADPADAEDAASEALGVVIGSIAAIESEAAASGTPVGSVIAEAMRLAGSRALGRIRRARGKAMSLDAPMSDDDEDAADFASQVVRSGNFDAEGYCDARRAVRLAERLPEADAELLMMMVDGMTADDMARELRVPTGVVRLHRAKLIRLMQDSMMRGDIA